MDSWLEMMDFLSRHKLRTGLTALSVAWGIFMLIILLGAGKGLQEGAQRDFHDDALNSIWVRPMKTSLPFGGHTPGRSVKLRNGDVEAIQREIPGVDLMSGRYNLWGAFSVTHGQKSAAFEVRGCHPDQVELERIVIVDGRYINDIDIRERRKVAVIGVDVRRELFGSEPPVGKSIGIRGVPYVVVGVYEDEGGAGELKKIYLPISTAQLVYGGQDRVHFIMFSTESSEYAENRRVTKATRELLARRHQFSADDRRALSIVSNLERVEKFAEIFHWIRVFVWSVGVGTIFSGMVAIGNIMLISVKERTVEIGIRKALGATPGSIVWMVLQESLFITSAAGYSGLVAGALVVEAVRRHLPPNDYIRSPEVDFRTAVIAALLLVVSGAVAGLIPALRAARVKPIVAMRGS